MGSGKGGEMVKRTFKTSIFVVALLMSLVTSSLPLLISVTDVVASYILFSTLVCRHGSSHLSFRSTWSSYSFPRSLVDIPLLSLLRSLAMLCTYSVCGIITGMSYGPYLLVSIVSGLGSAIFLLMKASFFANAGLLRITHEALISLHMKSVWGIFLLLACSMAMALGHIFVAYKVRIQAQRKMLLYRFDLEAVNAFLNARLSERHKRHGVEEANGNPLHDLSLKFLTNQGKS